MLKEFNEFAMRGNVLDMAVGIIIGAAFGAIVASFVGDVLMPVIGTLLGGVDFSNYFLVLKEGATPGPYPTLAAVKAAGGVAVGYGILVNTIVNFLIVAAALFMVIKAMNSAKKKEEAAPAAPPALSKEQVLLTEIRDLLARR
jgi:large conductance mechanosensitive channel